MSLTSKPLAVILVVVMFGGVFFSDLAGWWLTKGGRIPRQIQSSEFQGQPDPADMRGSYTFGDVETNFAVPASLIADAFKLTADIPEGIRLNALEQAYEGYEQEVGTESIKLFVAFYRGLPLDLTEEIFLPESAVAVLLERDLSADQLAYLEAHTVPSLDADVLVTGESAEDSEEHAGSTDTMIRGRTTFGELLQWGLSREQIEGVLGMKMPLVGGVLVRDYCSEQGLSYGQVKAGLQALLDQMEN